MLRVAEFEMTVDPRLRPRRDVLDRRDVEQSSLLAAMALISATPDPVGTLAAVR